MKKKRVRFKNSRGFMLSAQLDSPDSGNPSAYAIFAHCFTCNKNLKAINNIDKALTGAGIAVLRFDFTGLGESEGDFSDTNFSSNVDDLADAAAFLESDYAPPSILIGHSLGGAAVLQAAGGIASARAVVTIAAPSDPGHVSGLLKSTKEEADKKGEACVTLAGRTFKLKKQFFDDLESARMEESIAGLGKALLIMHSPVDEIVGIENAARIFKAARHPKSFISLDTSDHLLMDEADSSYAGAIIAAWSSRYIKTKKAHGK